MKIEQVYSLANDAISEVLGQEALIKEDWSNVVDVGQELASSDKLDHYVKSLLNRIGKIIFVNRVYKGVAPKVLMDGWRYGSIAQKIQCDIPDSEENPTWNLTNGSTYDMTKFKAPSVSAKYYNTRTTLQIHMSFAEKQVMESFASAVQMNAFFSMIENRIIMRKTMDFENFIMRTIDNFAAATIYNDYSTSASEAKISNTETAKSSGMRAVNLFYLFKERYPDTTVTAATAIDSPEFIRFASMVMRRYAKRMRKASDLFNIGGQTRFTPTEELHCIFHDDFETAAGVYLYSDVYHNDEVKLPQAETVPFWQGSGTNYAWSSTSAIHASIRNPKNPNAALPANAKEVDVTGIIGVMFDNEALGVWNKEDYVRSFPVAVADFINYWYKYEAQYFNDYNENFVVFFVA